ncbi:hypothetical protein HW555_006414, partial [Spodoptera exigua]
MLFVAKPIGVTLVMIYVTFTISLICVLIVKITLTNSFKVFDKLDANYYCVNGRRLCAESTRPAPHAVCRYHGHEGDCRHYKYYDISENMASEIVSRINRVRSAVANGQAEGEDGYLPKGYGMMRVSWDSELAAIAKLVIFMCHSQTDYTCAATSKFSNPIMAYLSSANVDSMEEAVDDILREFEEYRVMIDDVFVGPNIRNEEPKLRFLRLVVGDLTHIGCALAVYQSYQNDMTHLKCYMSHAPVQNMPVYNTDPPGPEDRTSPRCGCPSGYKEDEGCLCVPMNIAPSPTGTRPSSINGYYQPQPESINKLKPIKQMVRHHTRPNTFPTIIWPATETPGGSNDSCKPKIVMMPIFTLQNDPRLKRYGIKKNKSIEPSKLTLRSQLLYNVKKAREKEGIQFYSSEEKHSPTHNQKWKRIVSILDLLEMKGKSMNLTSREVMEARRKLKEIHEEVLGKTEYDLFDGVREAVIVANDVEETAKHCYGDKVHKPEGNFREDGTYNTGADVVYGDRFQTP